MLLSINILRSSILDQYKFMNQLVTNVIAATNADAFGRVLSPIISNIVNPILELLFAVAVVVFVYGVLRLVFGAADDSDARQRGKDSAIYGVIGMFIMVTAWGIINLIANTVKSI